MSVTSTKQASKTRSERAKNILRYRVTVLEEPARTLGGFEHIGMEVKLGKGRLAEFPPDARVLEVETTQEPLPMDVEVNAKYAKQEGKAMIVRRRSLQFKIEKIESSRRPI
ncbi:MAG: hypothetical protein NXY59_04935 [Aigarchaeota archaeon]|nr:hypothetical protein [Candidatus Pelearchaeum maunauluense]